MRLKTLPPLPAVALAMLSIQGGAVFAKMLFPQVGPTGATALRAGLGFLLLLALFRPNLRALNRADWLAIVPYGAVLGIMNLVFYQALDRLPLGLAVTLEFVGPLGVALFLSRRAVDFVWVALAALGIALIAPHSTATAHGVDPLGVALALLAGAFWGAYILLGGVVGRRVPGVTGVTAGLLVASVISVPLGVAHAGTALLSLPVLAAGLGVAALSAALPFSLEMSALRRLPARTFGIMMSVEPAFGALSGLIFLHEHLTLTQWLAMLCVIVASAGVQLTQQRTDLPLVA
ncbi:DMT family transporter [Deinococcus sp. KSM4-11]|uniref:EamA family transporter n=1 Tax=Deinococcus sp. KSM4-11 TaxID=2568654 RepID=UPI00267D4CFB